MCKYSLWFGAMTIHQQFQCLLKHFYAWIKGIFLFTIIFTPFWITFEVLYCMYEHISKQCGKMKNLSSANALIPRVMFDKMNRSKWKYVSDICKTFTVVIYLKFLPRNIRLPSLSLNQIFMLSTPFALHYLMNKGLSNPFIIHSKCYCKG